MLLRSFTLVIIKLEENPKTNKQAASVSLLPSCNPQLISLLENSLCMLFYCNNKLRNNNTAKIRPKMRNGVANM